MTESHERRITHDELSVIVFHCPGCRAEQALDVGNEKQVLSFVGQKLLPECPFCGTQFSAGLVKCLRGFLRWRDEVNQEQIVLTFRLPYRQGGE